MYYALPPLIPFTLVGPAPRSCLPLAHTKGRGQFAESAAKVFVERLHLVIAALARSAGVVVRGSSVHTPLGSQSIASVGETISPSHSLMLTGARAVSHLFSDTCPGPRDLLRWEVQTSGLRRQQKEI